MMTRATRVIPGQIHARTPNRMATAPRNATSHQCRLAESSSADMGCKDADAEVDMMFTCCGVARCAYALTASRWSAPSGLRRGLGMKGIEGRPLGESAHQQRKPDRYQHSSYPSCRSGDRW